MAWDHVILTPALGQAIRCPFLDSGLVMKRWLREAADSIGRFSGRRRTTVKETGSAGCRLTVSRTCSPSHAPSSPIPDPRPPALSLQHDCSANTLPADSTPRPQTAVSCVYYLCDQEGISRLRSRANLMRGDLRACPSMYQSTSSFRHQKFTFLSQFRLQRLLLIRQKS